MLCSNGTNTDLRIIITGFHSTAVRAFHASGWQASFYYPRYSHGEDDHCNLQSLWNMILSKLCWKYVRYMITVNDETGISKMISTIKLEYSSIHHKNWPQVTTLPTSGLACRKITVLLLHPVRSIVSNTAIPAPLIEFSTTHNLGVSPALTIVHLSAFGIYMHFTSELGAVLLR